MIEGEPTSEEEPVTEGEWTTERRSVDGRIGRQHQACCVAWFATAKAFIVPISAGTADAPDTPITVAVKRAISVVRSVTILRHEDVTVC